MIDAIKSYMQMASGILEAGADKAREAAQGAVSQGLESGTKAPEQLASQMALIAEDLMEQSKTNRELVVGLVRTEVERAVGRIGFVREEELAAVRAHVDRLEGQLRETIEKVSAVPAQAAEEAGVGLDSAKTLAESTALRKMGLTHAAPEVTDVPAKKTVVRRPEGDGDDAADSSGAAAPATKAAAKKTTAKKATAKKAPAKKTTAKKATAAKAPAASGSATDDEETS